MRDESAERAHVAEALRNQLASRAEILFAYRHGSFIGGGSYRDIDVAVWLDPSRVRGPEPPETSTIKDTVSQEHGVRPPTGTTAALADALGTIDLDLTPEALRRQRHKRTDRGPR